MRSTSRVWSNTFECPHNDMVDAPYSVLQREALEFISEAADVAVWQWDPQADLVHLDARTARECRLSASLSTAEFLQSALAAEERDIFRRALESALTSPEARASIRAFAGGGRVRTFDLRLRACRDAASAAIRVIIVASDVPRARADTSPTEAERAASERLAIATQAAGIYVWEFDYAAETITWDENRLTRPASNRHFGLELGSDLFKWVHPDRSEERRVGKECRSWWSAGHSNVS